MPTIHLLITGKVQGVFYRASAKEKADELNLTGWIKNTANGDVEAIASGTGQQLQQFMEWCKKGPQRAEVANVTVSEFAETSFEEFKVVRQSL